MELNLSYSFDWVDLNLNFYKATTGAAQMVKSKSMDVVKAVSEDLTEIKDSAVQYTSNVG